MIVFVGRFSERGCPFLSGTTLVAGSVIAWGVTKYLLIMKYLYPDFRAISALRSLEKSADGALAVTLCPEKNIR